MVFQKERVVSSFWIIGNILHSFKKIWWCNLISLAQKILTSLLFRAFKICIFLFVYMNALALMNCNFHWGCVIFVLILYWNSIMKSFFFFKSSSSANYLSILDFHRNCVIYVSNNIRSSCLKTEEVNICRNL